MSVVGVVLAGGLGRRLGGDKALAAFAGRPLLDYPLAALAGVTDARAVVAKAATRLPPLPVGVERWNEPATPQHPLTGILHALARAGGRPVLCCAVDLPRLDAPTLARLLAAATGQEACVVARADGRLQPLCALWFPRAGPLLAALPPEPSLRAALAAVDAREVDYADAGPFTNVKHAGGPPPVSALSRT